MSQNSIIDEPSGLLAVSIALHVIARLTYTVFIGMRLRSAERTPVSDAAEQHARWRRFRRHAALILRADAITSGLVLLASMNTLTVLDESLLVRLVGVALVALGIGVKLSAYRVIGDKGYYWYNFFCDGTERSYVRRGIYRYLDNPMYGPGYLHAIGFALVLLSFWGLVTAVFDWIAVWVFHAVFERPHTLRHAQRTRAADARIRWLADGGRRSHAKRAGSVRQRT